MKQRGHTLHVLQAMFHDSMTNFSLFESNDPHTFLYAFLNNLFRLNCHLSQYIKCKITFFNLITYAQRLHLKAP